MAKIDFKKELRELYQPSTKNFSLVEVPPMNFLMIDGHGDPNTAVEYQEAVKALYAVAYALKFMSKKEKESDFVVPPLEGLWWVDDMATFSEEEKDRWDWTMMIMQPDSVDQEMVDRAIREVEAKKSPPRIDKVRFETYHEGLSVQIMYIGSYSEEGPTIERLHKVYLPENGLEEAGKHHEIYLGDPRRTAPEKLKTVIRQPVTMV